jgi:putative membrane protein
MRLLSTLLWIALFLVLLVFSIENTRNVDLRLFGQVLTAPLVVLLLAFFAIGVVMGLLAAVPSWFRGRREIARLTREIQAAGGAVPAAAPPGTGAGAPILAGAVAPRPAVAADVPLADAGPR